MTRGVAHSPELRADVIAAVMTGTPVNQAARDFGIDKATVSEWCARAHVPTVPTAVQRLAMIEGLLLDLVAEHATTLRAELQAAASPAWLEKQSAADLAQLVVAQRDTLIRLLAGFRPVVDEPDQPRLDAPGPSAAEQ